MNKKDFRKHIIEGIPGGAIAFYHNLPDTFGMNIDGAITNWAMRTNDYTLKSFAAYVAGKGIGAKVISKEEYQKLK